MQKIFHTFVVTLTAAAAAAMKDKHQPLFGCCPDTMMVQLTLVHIQCNAICARSFTFLHVSSNAEKNKSELTLKLGAASGNNGPSRYRSSF